LEAGRGVTGDRYSRKDGNRQVTLIGSENLAAISAFLGTGLVDPGVFRRNIVVEGLNLLALEGTALPDRRGDPGDLRRMSSVLADGRGPGDRRL
jgi:hypothetical protein